MQFLQFRFNGQKTPQIQQYFFPIKINVWHINEIILNANYMLQGLQLIFFLKLKFDIKNTLK